MITLYGIRDPLGNFARLMFHKGEVVIHIYPTESNSFTVMGETFAAVAMTPTVAAELGKMLTDWAATAEPCDPPEQG